MSKRTGRVRTIIMGAASRNFHNFNVVFREGETTEVVAFTAARISGINGRVYPPALALPAGAPAWPAGECDPPPHARRLLADQAIQRLATRADLGAADCMIEEREEYEPHIAAGGVILAVVDRFLEESPIRAEIPPSG